MNSLTSAIFLMLGLAIGQVPSGRDGVVIALISVACLLLLIQELIRMGAFRRSSRKQPKPLEPIEINVDMRFHAHPQGAPCTDDCGPLHRQETAP